MSYSDFSVENAVAIVQACLDAGRQQMIIPALLDRRSPESVIAELAAARTTRVPPATRRTADAGSFVTDELAAVIEKRFRAQNGPRTR